MRRPWLVALVAGLAGLALGFLLGQMVAAPGEAGTVTSAPTLSAPRTATQATRASEVTAAARIDTVPFVADRPPASANGRLPDLGTIVTGRVWEPAGEPAAGAHVNLYRSVAGDGKSRWVMLRETQTDAGGRYVVTADAGWQVRLQVSQSGFLPAGLSDRKVARGINTIEDIVLAEGVSVSGTVRDGEGEPVPGVRVAVRMWHPEYSGPVHRALFRKAKTGWDGQFIITALDPRLRLRIAPHHRTLLARPAARDVDAGAANVDFVLQEGGIIRGRITGVEPSVRHTLHVHFIVEWEPEGPDARGRPTRNLIPGDDRIPRSEVDAEGDFEVRGLGACSGDLLVTQDLSFSPARIYDITRVRGLSIAPGEVLEGLEIAMCPAAAVDGRVMDENGQGVPGIRIEVNGREPTRNRLQLTVSTDASGRFHFPGVPRIPLRIEAQELPGLICSSLRDFVPGSGEAIVRLSRPATLEGSIPEHLLADEHLIHFEPLGPLGMVRNWPARPKFSCTGLWPGRYRIQLIDEKGQVIEELGTVLLRPGETTQLP